MIILCPSCKELMRANEQERHNERECPERTLNCKYCKEAFQLKSIKVSFFPTLAASRLLISKVLPLLKAVGTYNLQPDVLIVITRMINPPTASLMTGSIWGPSWSGHLLLTVFTLFLGSRWNLSKVSDDVWRLFKEKDPQRKGGYFFIRDSVSQSRCPLNGSVLSFFSMWIISSTAANLNHPADFMWLAATCL